MRVSSQPGAFLFEANDFPAGLLPAFEIFGGVRAAGGLGTEKIDSGTETSGF